MSHRLHRVLHEVATAATFEHPDVERLVRLGKIRARRMAALGMALALTVAASILVLQDDDEDESRARLDAPAPDVRRRGEDPGTPETFLDA